MVLDLFGGSGSTIIAAQKTGRRAYLCEIDPVYCDRSIARWEKHAKDDAILVACGWPRATPPDTKPLPPRSKADGRRKAAKARRKPSHDKAGR